MLNMGEMSEQFLILNILSSSPILSFFLLFYLVTDTDKVLNCFFLSFACRFRVMTKRGQKQKVVKEKELVEKDTTPSSDADEEEVNSGFGSYLRSSTGKAKNSICMCPAQKKRNSVLAVIAGQETLRLFVVVNSLVMFLTLAWPQMKSVYEIIEEFITERFGSIDLF